MTKAPEPTFDGCVTFDPKYKLVREARVKDDTIMVAGEIAMANKVEYWTVRRGTRHRERQC